MAKIKLCGLRRPEDIEYANIIKPEYVGFVFAKNSRRYVNYEMAKALRDVLDKDIIPVGVFVDEKIEVIVDLLAGKIIDAVQLHGNEDEEYIKKLRSVCDCTIIKAFKVKDLSDIDMANSSSADFVLLDSGNGSGESFDWSLVEKMERPYFMAGGLTPENVGRVVKEFAPFAVDASSSLETDGIKDKEKMMAFVEAVRGGECEKSH